MPEDLSGLRILGIDSDDPYDVQTFSGSSRYIWSELLRREVLVDAFTPNTSRAATLCYKARAFRPSIQQWRASWRRSLPFRRYLSRRAARIIGAKYDGRYNASLQIGAYYNFSDVVDGPKGLLADNNCAISQKTNRDFQSSHRLWKLQFDFERSVYKSMDRIFCFSAFLAKSMIEDFGCDPDRVRVVGAGINIDEAAVFTRHRDYGTKTILFSGFNWEGKGGPVLLEAFAHVRRQEPDAKLVLLGPQLGETPEGVICHGPLSKDDPNQVAKIYEAFRQSSVFVLPTLADAFPNVIREAMAAGLPCVASDTGAIPEMVEDGVTGFLVPLRDPTRLAKRLLTLVRHPELAGKMGQAGYQQYVKCFTWASVCDTIIEEMQFNLASQRAARGVEEEVAVDTLRKATG